MRPKDQKQGNTLISFVDMKAFETFVREVDGVEIIAPDEKDQDALLTLLVD